MRPPCETGYTCEGCGSWYDADPAGTDAWWFACECGGIAEPALDVQGRLL